LSPRQDPPGRFPCRDRPQSQRPQLHCRGRLFLPDRWTVWRSDRRHIGTRRPSYSIIATRLLALLRCGDPRPSHKSRPRTTRSPLFETGILGKLSRPNVCTLGTGEMQTVRSIAGSTRAVIATLLVAGLPLLPAFAADDLHGYMMAQGG